MLSASEFHTYKCRKLRLFLNTQNTNRTRGQLLISERNNCERSVLHASTENNIAFQCKDSSRLKLGLKNQTTPTINT